MITQNVFLCTPFLSFLTQAFPFSGVCVCVCQFVYVCLFVYMCVHAQKALTFFFFLQGPSQIPWVFCHKAAYLNIIQVFTCLPKFTLFFFSILRGQPWMCLLTCDTLGCLCWLLVCSAQKVCLTSSQRNGFVSSILVLIFSWILFSP